jgi:hypothetical protein
MYLHNGWEQFARVHNLEVGWNLNFMYEGGCEHRVKVFDGKMYRKHYHNNNESGGGNIDYAQKPLVYISR